MTKEQPTEAPKAPEPADDDDQEHADAPAPELGERGGWPAQGQEG